MTQRIYHVMELVGRQELPQGHRVLEGFTSRGAALSGACDQADAYWECGHYLNDPRWVVVDDLGQVCTTVRP